MLPVGPGVCEVCRSNVSDDYVRCWACNQARNVLPYTADAVGFISLAVKRKQLAHELWEYKNGSPEIRERLEPRLAALIWRWLVLHEVCLTGETDWESFEIVTTVPSASGRVGIHPLERMVSTTIGPTKARYRCLLQVDPSVAQDRELNVDRWQAVQLSGESVLLIDDTWTTGGHVQSAAAALRRGGAGSVAILCIGRHYNSNQTGDFQDAAQEYVRRSRTLGWDWNSCCFETPPA